ncbi:hypothetical protein C7441_1166 [Pseudaminobacter salicylatoxidans]|uniref:Uncharacterized protein n=1 Tax=Pseudaminobacter salicylatoxidans TaxID=93369 RepID=A0A316BVU2_PSESE|nr:hypothetical protein C7441_1166 [Pseudaminobacter salicylatoxidans]
MSRRKLKAWALSTESFELPDTNREVAMLRAVYMLGSLVAIVVTTAFLLPLALFIAASKLWEAAELHTRYKGDVAARDRDHWRSS